MPTDPLSALAAPLRIGVALVAAGTLAFGAWSAAWPARSIRLYQRIMAWCNWRVHPIDERRELTTTRALGLLITVCSLAALRLCAKYR